MHPVANISGRIRHRKLAWLLAASLMLRALIPLGYMPGNVLAGEYMVLCPAGLPPLARASGHHEHHAAADETTSLDQACPIGTAMLQAAAPAPAFPELASPRPRSQLFMAPPVVGGDDFFRHYLSRAPPPIRFQPV